jgi:hypothetical protein
MSLWWTMKYNSIVKAMTMKKVTIEIENRSAADSRRPPCAAISLL